MRHAGELGVQVAIENCPMIFSYDEWPGGNNLAYNPHAWRAMFAAIPDAHFGLNLDPSHLVWQMIDVERVVHEFGDRILHAHGKDLEVRPDGLYEHGVMSTGIGWQVPRLCGHGQVDWGRFIGALYAVGYDGVVSIEHEDRRFEGDVGARQARLPDRAQHAAAADRVSEGLAKLAPGAGERRARGAPGARRPDPATSRCASQATGVCGTDLHIEAGEYPSVPPVTMGHEVCGVVETLGAGVDGGWDGVRVVSETYYATCGRCALLPRRAAEPVRARQSIGTHVDGAFAPRVIVPAHGLHRLPDGLGATERLALGAAGLRLPVAARPAGDLRRRPRARARPGRDRAARRAGRARRRRRGDRPGRAARRGAARRSPASSASPRSSPARRRRAASTSSSSARAASPGIAQALESVRRGGRIVQIGLRGAPVTVDWDLICFHELTVTSGFASTPASWRRAMALLESRAVALGPLVSAVLPLARWREAFDDSRAGRAVKAVLQPSSTSKETSSV